MKRAPPFLSTEIMYCLPKFLLENKIEIIMDIKKYVSVDISKIITHLFLSDITKSFLQKKKYNSFHISRYIF